MLDGYRMRYLRAGSGPPLLLLHGLLGYSFSWRFTIPALAGKATLYAVDMPGVGFSDRPPNSDGSLRAHAERLVRFLDGVGVASFDLLGTSHGGAVAMMALVKRRMRALGNGAAQPRRYSPVVTMLLGQFRLALLTRRYRAWLAAAG